MYILKSPSYTDPFVPTVWGTSVAEYLFNTREITFDLKTLLLREYRTNYESELKDWLVDHFKVKIDRSNDTIINDGLVNITNHMTATCWEDSFEYFYTKRRVINSFRRPTCKEEFFLLRDLGIWIITEETFIEYFSESPEFEQRLNSYITNPNLTASEMKWVDYNNVKMYLLVIKVPEKSLSVRERNYWENTNIKSHSAVHPYLLSGEEFNVSELFDLFSNESGV